MVAINDQGNVKRERSSELYRRACELMPAGVNSPVRAFGSVHGDPLFIARRLVVCASEDLGNADPRALVIATAAKDAVEFVGYPECRLALSQLVTYLSLAPKSML